MENDGFFMQLCLELAAKGRGSVSPNPLVGAVITKNNSIIGTGYHENFGGFHAERNALLHCSESAAGATIYVNLEPCDHFGKTPPCTQAIIQHKLSRVVVGSPDPNPLVAGKGIAKLRAEGIEVTTGCLEEACNQLNKGFFKHIQTGLPFFTIKIAQTLDAKIADNTKEPALITNQQSRAFVHQLRSEHDAVLVGINTLRTDDPSLDVRHVSGANPAVIILDSNLNTSAAARIWSVAPGRRVIIVCSHESRQTKGTRVLELEQKGAEIVSVCSGLKGIDLTETAAALGKMGITSVLVEGGSAIFSSFIRQNIYDDIIFCIAPKILGTGVQAIGDIGKNLMKDATELKLASVRQFENDICIHYKRKE